MKKSMPKRDYICWYDSEAIYLIINIEGNGALYEIDYSDSVL